MPRAKSSLIRPNLKHIKKTAKACVVVGSEGGGVCLLVTTLLKLCQVCQQVQIDKCHLTVPSNSPMMKCCCQLQSELPAISHLLYENAHTYTHTALVHMGKHVVQICTKCFLDVDLDRSISKLKENPKICLQFVYYEYCFRSSGTTKVTHICAFHTPIFAHTQVYFYFFICNRYIQRICLQKTPQQVCRELLFFSGDELTSFGVQSICKHFSVYFQIWPLKRYKNKFIDKQIYRDNLDI